MSRQRLSVYSLAHMLVDAACASVIMTTPNLAAVFLLYNTFAFSSQCVLGLLEDRHRAGKQLAPVACVLVALCCFLPIPPLLNAVCIGLGNSLFHVAAGSEVLRGSGGKAAPLGLFVAPGALGVFCGKAAPQWKLLLGAVLLACTAWLFLAGRRDSRADSFKADTHAFPSTTLVLLLLLAVGTRAIGGVMASRPGQSTLYGAFAVLLVFLGKSAGGFLNDRLGSSLTAWISLPLAVVFLLLGNDYGICFGQFLLNLSMPITLYLLYRCMPDSPGFAFGLAASALWPGTLLAQYLSFGGSLHILIVILCFSLSLYAILYAERSLPHEKKN